jgi:hypothetical protein
VANCEVVNARRRLPVFRPFLVPGVLGTAFLVLEELEPGAVGRLQVSDFGLREVADDVRKEVREVAAPDRDGPPTDAPPGRTASDADPE